MDRYIAKSDFVIVICTETYYRHIMDEEEPGKGRGVTWSTPGCIWPVRRRKRRGRAWPKPRT